MSESRGARQHLVRVSSRHRPRLESSPSSTRSSDQPPCGELGADSIARPASTGRASVSTYQARRAEDLRLARQHEALREKRHAELRQKRLGRAGSAPELDSTSATASIVACEGCMLSLRLHDTSDSFYVCNTCLCRTGVVACLCTACFDVRDFVHEGASGSDGAEEHDFLHNKALAGSVSALKSLPKVDFHQHCRHLDWDGLEELRKACAQWNVERAVLLALRPPYSSREDVAQRNAWVLEAAARHPERIVPFVTIVEDDPMAPKMFADCLKRGARGLKLIGWHSGFIEKFDYDLQLSSLLEVFRLAAAWGVPVLAHIYVAYEGRRNYVQDIDAVLTAVPNLKFVLAHMGLGFNEEHQTALERLAAKHRSLYFDTSFYGGYKEVWFSRASARAAALRRFVLRFPRQVLFASDVFADSRGGANAQDYALALKASVGFLEASTFACLEFRRTDYFDVVERDKFGPVRFDPLHLKGLDLAAGQEAVLQRLLRDNALELLGCQAKIQGE